MRKGFTLVELLVVIGIIAVLAAILFPVLARAKASARGATCVSNMKQVGTAINMYLADYDGMFPSALDASDKYCSQIWTSQPMWKAQIATMPLLADVLQPYTKSKEIFHCPSDIGTEVLDNQPAFQFKTAPSLFAVYGNSYFLRTEIVFRSFTDTAFQRPANINVMMDGGGHWHGTGRAVEGTDDLTTSNSLMGGYRYNVLYGDFHVKSVSRSTLNELWSTPL